MKKRDFVCNQCNKSYASNFNLKRHQESSCPNRSITKVMQENNITISEDSDEIQSLGELVKNPIQEEKEKNNTLLKNNNSKISILNEAIERIEQGMKDNACDKYIMARLRDALASEIIDDIKKSSVYAKNKAIADEIIELFEPSKKYSGGIEEVILHTMKNRIDLIKSDTDRVTELNKQKRELLVENSKLTHKLIKLMKET